MPPVPHYHRDSTMRITPRTPLPTHKVIAHDAETKKKDCELRITFAPRTKKYLPAKSYFPTHNH